MKRTQALKVLGMVSGSFLLVIAFQNCGQNLGEGFVLDTKAVQLNSGSSLPVDDSLIDDETSEEQSTGDICEDQLYAKFGAGYYVFLKNNCAGCHNGEHEAPAFASKNSLSSYQVFRDKGYLAVSANAISANHNPPSTGAHHNGTISSLKADWENAVTAWAQCKGSDVEDKSVVTGNKTDANIVNKKSESTYWSKLSWNMNTAGDMPTNAAKLPLTISVEVQVAKVGGTEVGYAIKNPTMGIASGSAKYRVKGLFFYVNNVLNDAATVYRGIDAVICPNVSLNLAPVGNAQLIVTASRKTTDKFALQFSSIEKVDASAKCGTGSNVTVPVDTTPEKVTFAQLTSTDANLGVFRSQCFSCHQGASSQGGLDLSSYSQSKSKAAKILLRINDANAPMPRSGLMSSKMRAIVEKWVNTNTPEK
ncbi:hypothetical protein AZI87_12255 [Bdellovibrio bacteriovorus]|uniref:Cytochrome c domain-containing protein n=1 Tax=Bdellovibrio bacteriovorus TaxID=959 RepID=A0A161PQY7_BDEBC|nr:hypothetical protein [Bdellovibrio bacteriovorus]KYG65320.1 hypothetical protein AZI87_12255 [Bdellovibrio bacteriovorus]